MVLLIKENNKVPRHKKFALTIQEATQYFGIGERKLRQIISEYNNCDWILYNGVKVLIKREKFEKFLNQITTI